MHVEAGRRPTGDPCGKAFTNRSIFATRFCVVVSLIPDPGSLRNSDLSTPSSFAVCPSPIFQVDESLPGFRGVEIVFVLHLSSNLLIRSLCEAATIPWSSQLLDCRGHKPCWAYRKTTARPEDDSRGKLYTFTNVIETPCP